MQLLRDQDEINLLEAAQDGKLEFIQEQLGPLLNDKSKIGMLERALTKRDFYGRNTLHYAAYRGHAEVVQYFLELKSPFIKINCRDNQGNTPLMLACVRGYNSEVSDLTDGSNRKFQICKMLTDQGADLKMYSREGINNPLHWACYFGDILTTKLLVDKIPGLMLLRNDFDYFPVDHTLMSQKEKLDTTQDKLVAEFLILTFLVNYLESTHHKTLLDEINKKISLTRSVDEVNEEDRLLGEQQLQHSVSLQIQSISRNPYQQQQLNMKIKKFKNDKRFDLMGHRYLYWASIMGREDLAISLIQYTYSPFVMSYKGRNSVHAAAYHGHLHLLKLFFESEITKPQLKHIGGIKKAVNLMTVQQPETALHIAIQQGNQEVVSYLYSLGADPEIHNFRNLTAFETTRDTRVKQIKQNLYKQSSEFKKNLVRSGYKYILVGREYLNQKDDLLFQQLINIQEKNYLKGKCKVLILKHYENQYELKEDISIPAPNNLVYYLLKVSDALMNEIADEERLMVYNLREGFICRFLKEQSDVYENFHHRQVQQIMLKLMNDEFDLEQFVNDGIVVDHFPLHDFEERRSLEQFWAAEKWTILVEPFKIDKITIRSLNALSSYYGAEVGFFFVFLTFFTSWLTLPAIPGICLGVYSLVSESSDNAVVPIYIIFLAVWATIFFEFWKRKQNEIAFELDMHITKEEKKRLPQYKGQFTVEEVTHEIVIVDKRSEVWKYVKSVTPLILFGIGMIALQFYVFDYLLEIYSESFYEFYYVSIGYALSITLTNEIFHMTTRITLNYENHQFQDDKENVYILKVFSFTFMNCYIRLFYRSIVEPNSKNPKELVILTSCFTIVWALVHFTRYNLIPYFIYHHIIPNIFLKKFQNKNVTSQAETGKKKVYTLSSNKSQLPEQNSDTKTQALVEKNINESEQNKFLEEIERTRLMMVSTNYVEQFTYLIIQFGNVAMFSSNFELVPTIIMVTNWFNIESIFHSYCHYVKRPIAMPKKGIGLWNDILLVVGYIATVINCLTIYQAKQDQLKSLIGSSQGALTNFLLLIAAEHIVIGIKFIIESVIPDVPDWVEDALKRQDYLEEQWHLRMKVVEQAHDNRTESKFDFDSRQQAMIE